MSCQCTPFPMHATSQRGYNSKTDRQCDDEWMTNKGRMHWRPLLWPWICFAEVGSGGGGGGGEGLGESCYENWNTNRHNIK